MADVTTAVPSWLDRTFSPRVVGDLARAFEASGVVDEIQIWDQLNLFWPASLWTVENTAQAHIVKDAESWPDASVTAAFCAAATTKLGITVTGDAVRRGPAEIMQTMLALADATEGRATLTLGAGEQKQCRPFGYKRSDALARMEDLLRLFRLMWEAEGPFDFEGNVWKFQNAWIGGTHNHKPRFWAMGGGPKLIEISAKYADGFTTVVPGGVSSPEQFAELVGDVRTQLERNDRDPDAFTFGLWAICLMHEDPEVIETALANPLVKWFAATAGRLNQAEWEREGIEPVFPKDWHYAMKMIPYNVTAQEADSVVAKVTREMAAKGFLTGSPSDISTALEPYVEAGATWISVCDMLPLVLPLDEAPAAIDRTFELCRRLKKL
jgi:phthiodiolone/phenolphthiodiolone dimycocerosates ketoreductase